MKPHAPQHGTPLHHEESDVDARGIFAFTLGLTLVTLVVGAVVWVLLGYLDEREAVTTTDFPLAVGETRIPSGPRLQVEPRAEMRTLAAEDEALLTSYGWVNRDLGLVRVPIDVAMRMTLERGLAARAATSEPAAAAPAAPPGGAPQP